MSVQSTPVLVLLKTSAAKACQLVHDGLQLAVLLVDSWESSLVAMVAAVAPAKSS